MSQHDNDEALTLSAWDDERQIGVKLEDDGQAAFAYLWDGTTTLSAVWLYNHPGAEVHMPRSPADLPTPNLPEYIVGPPVAPLTDDSQVQINFRGSSFNEYIALVFLHDRPHAALSTVQKIGWCVSARSGGPYAKPMTVLQQADGTFSIKLE